MTDAAAIEKLAEEIFNKFERVDVLVNNIGVDVFFESSGAISYINQSLDLTECRGTIALVGFYEDSLIGFDINRLVMEHKRILGCEGSGWLAPKVIDMVSKKDISLSPMITGKVPFSNAIEAIRSANENTEKKIRTVIEISSH